MTEQHSCSGAEGGHQDAEVKSFEKESSLQGIVQEVDQQKKESG